jgi:hypothetical protein
MDAFLVNCKPENWDICNKYTIFGLKDTSNFPPLTKGDLILLRISGTNYGLKAVWYFEYAKKVVNQKNIQLNDEDYTWIINCKKILTLSKRFSEEFQTSSKKSSKITDLYAGGIQKTVVDIKKPQLRDYIFHIFKEFSDELNVNCNYLGEDVNVKELLQKILTEIVAVTPFPDTEEYKINETVPEKKKKLNNPDSNLQEKSDKSSKENKEKSEEKNSQKNEKSDKTEVKPAEIVNEPPLKNEEKLAEASSGLLELSDKPPIENKEKSEKQISEKNEKSDKTEIEPAEIVNKPTLRNEEKFAEPSSNLLELSDKSPIKKEEKPDKQISEQKEKQEKIEEELIEMANDPNFNQNTELKESVIELNEDQNEIVAVANISKQRVYERVGERVNLPVLSYAPLNEKGILLLFGHYMLKLGFSHVEEIRTDFPDVIAVRSVGNGKYQRVRIGFEFKSSSFLEKGHEINECDLIVCWNHDWNNCPIEVIELSKVLFEK